MGLRPAERLELLDGDPHWMLFCAAFDIEDLNYSDPCVAKVSWQFKRFFGNSDEWRLAIKDELSFDDTPTGAEDFFDPELNREDLSYARFKADFRRFIGRSGFDNAFNVFLNRYSIAPDVELAFDVEPEYRTTNLQNYITRKVVLLRREFLPMEIHEYKKYETPWMVWLNIGQKLIVQKEDLTHEEVMQFSAGLTHFKDRLLYAKGDETDMFYLEGEWIDFRRAINIFYEDYTQDTRIDDELKEVEFFLARFNLPKKYFTEVVDFFCKIEEFFRDRYRKSERAKRAASEPAPEFTHMLHVFRLAFGGLEVAKHYPDLIPEKGIAFWQQLKSPDRLLSLAIRIGGHDIPEDEKKLEVTGLLQILQAYLVRASQRLFQNHRQAQWVEQEFEAMNRLNSKTPREPNYPGQTPYSVYTDELLLDGDATDVYLKLCDDLHNQTSCVPSNYDQHGEPTESFVQKIKDKEPLVEKGLEIGFYWMMPLRTLQRVFQENGSALLRESHGWRTIYTEIYLPRGGEKVASLKI